MSEATLNIIKIALAASVTGLVFAQGLQVSPADLFALRRRPGLLLRAALAGYILVPLATLVIVLLVRPALNVTVGLALLAAAPVAPLMVIRIPRAGGQLAQVVALHLAMTVSALLATPIVLAVMGSVLGFEVRVDYPRVALVIAQVVVFPVCCGVAIRGIWPAFAQRWAPRLGRACWIVFVVFVVALLVLGSGTLLRIDARSYAAMTLAITAALLIGHVLAPRAPAERLTMAMITAARHPGVVLLVAAANFPAANALAVLIPYLIVFLVASAAYVRWTSAALVQSEESEWNRAVPFVAPHLQRLGVKP